MFTCAHALYVATIVIYSSRFGRFVVPCSCFILAFTISISISSFISLNTVNNKNIQIYHQPLFVLDVADITPSV